MDFTDNLKPAAILQYFQDIATNHAIALNIGHDDMRAKGLLWILSRVSYRCFKPLSYGSEITIYTFPQKPRRVDVNRVYYIFDENGELIVSGTSKWCALNIKTRFISRMEGIFDILDDGFFECEPFEDGNIAIRPSLEWECGEFTEQNAKVLLTDLDKNLHMNNARYGDVILNCLTPEELTKKRITALDINYLAELKYNQDYKVLRASKDGSVFFEALRTSSSGENKPEAVFRAKIQW